MKYLKEPLRQNLEYIMACLLKARTVKPAEIAITRERLCKHAVARQWLSSRHMMAATDTHATIEELLEAVFSVRSLPNLYNEDQLSVLVEPESRERECRQTVS
jgi:hypothetical protein